MARPNVPTIPDDKKWFFREQLYRELSHLFQWEGLPKTVPQDYLERNLVRNGYVLFYEAENIGMDVLRAEVVGYNRHDLPTSARTFTPTTNGEVYPQITRNIKYLSDSEDVNATFDSTQDGVLIRNMEFGQNSSQIVDHFAHRLALAQQAFDTNLLYANIPYIFQTGNDDTRLSIEKMFADMFSGKPFIINDKELFKDNQDRTGVPSGITFIGKDLLDVHNEIMMKFRQTVGINTAGVDKAERVGKFEVDANTQGTKTVLQIMLEQREMACEAINEFFGLDVTVTAIGTEELDYQEDEQDEPGGEDDGTDDSGTEELN